MRNMGKANSAKATKAIRKFIMGLGAIEMTNKPSLGEPIYEGRYALGMKRTEPNAFIMETIIGLMWLKIDCSADSSVYTVFGRFDDVVHASMFLGTNSRLNHNSGKFNFHYSSIEDLMYFLHNELVPLVTDRTVITTFDELDKLGEDVTYDADKIIFVFDGIVYKHHSVSIDPAKYWRDAFPNWRGKKFLMVDANATLISKSSQFQLIMDGNVNEVK